MAWRGVVWLRVGELPTAGEQTGLPFVGLVQGLELWGPAEVGVAALLVAAVVLAWRRNDTWGAIVIMHLVLSSLMGEIVWGLRRGFASLLPGSAIGLAAWIAEWRPAATEATLTRQHLTVRC